MNTDRTKTDTMYPEPVFERDEYIRSRDYEKLFDWAKAFLGNRKPEFMLNFQNLRRLG